MFIVIGPMCNVQLPFITAGAEIIRGPIIHGENATARVLEIRLLGMFSTAVCSTVGINLIRTG